jgi:hypothetical protein
MGAGWLADLACDHPLRPVCRRGRRYLQVEEPALGDPRVSANSLERDVSDRFLTAIRAGIPF